ncbi:MAG: hypothetical protein Kow0029_28850 [Candidatus Rifleibacteriota bacterium]
MSEKLRLFYALEVPDDVKEELKRYCDGIDRKNWRVVKPDQFHITLAFMGEVDEKQLNRVIMAGEKASAIDKFQLDIVDTGIFPEAGEPRVLYARVQSDEIMPLANVIREQLKDLCDMKKFKPHLTLARRKGDRPRKEIRKIRASWQADSLVLVKSVLSNYCARHEILKRFYFKENS